MIPVEWHRQTLLRQAARSLRTLHRRRRDRIVVLQLDNAGWHTPETLPVPDGIRLVYQPAYSPELQPAEHLWPLVDEPLANKHFDTIDDLDADVALRCRDLNFDRSLIAQHTGFH